MHASGGRRTARESFGSGDPRRVRRGLWRPLPSRPDGWPGENRVPLDVSQGLGAGLLAQAFSRRAGRCPATGVFACTGCPGAPRGSAGAAVSSSRASRPSEPRTGKWALPAPLGHGRRAARPGDRRYVSRLDLEPHVSVAVLGRVHRDSGFQGPSACTQVTGHGDPDRHFGGRARRASATEERFAREPIGCRLPLRAWRLRSSSGRRRCAPRRSGVHRRRGVRRGRLPDPYRARALPQRHEQDPGPP